MLAPVMEKMPDGLSELRASPPVSAIQLVVVRTSSTSAELVDTARSILAAHVGAERVETQDHSHFALPT